MRIAWHVGIEKSSTGRIPRAELLWQACETYIARVASPGTTVELAFSRFGALSLHPYLCAVSNLLIAEEVAALQEKGFDAVLLGSSQDPGLDEARNIVDIPVVAAIESSLAFSTFLGRKAAILTIQGIDGERTYPRAMEGAAQKYGLRERLIAHRPVRTYPYANAEFWKVYTRALEGDGNDFLQAFDRVTAEMVNDGAEVIILGMEFTGALLHKLGRTMQTRDGIPCLDVAAVGIKNLESLVSLRRSSHLQKSQESVFRTAPAPLLEAARGYQRKNTA
jgi:allantoin racemase